MLDRLIDGVIDHSRTFAAIFRDWEALILFLFLVGVLVFLLINEPVFAAIWVVGGIIGWLIGHSKERAYEA